MTENCPARTTGPRHLPCSRTDEHLDGHVFDAGDVPDAHHDDTATQEDQ